MKKEINTERAPAAIGPYAQAVAVDGLVITWPAADRPVDRKLSGRDRRADETVSDERQGDTCGSGGRDGPRD